MNLSELVIVPVRRDEEEKFLALMRQHHYLGAPHKIGESAFYAAVLQGRWVALSSFYAAALKSRARDEWLGWHPRDRGARLHLITNQSRFLILEPDCESRIPHFIVAGQACRQGLAGAIRTPGAADGDFR